MFWKSAHHVFVQDPSGQAASRAYIYEKRISDAEAATAKAQRDLEVLKCRVAERLDRLMEHLGLEEVEIPATPASTEIRKKVKGGK